MIIQISSGQGPVECELAVFKLYESLSKEFKDICMISGNQTNMAGCYTTIQISTEKDLTFLEGTVQWICKSPFRPQHKRKNWFVDVSILNNDKTSASNYDTCTQINKNDLKWEYFHCGGKGGQNVNKVETGVRLTHIPTGVVVTSTAERTQSLNRKDALNKLKSELQNRLNKQHAYEANTAWQQHNQIVRGNPVRIYKGMQFKQVI